jgi:hypothetical protein
MALPKVFKVLGILPASLLLLTVYALTHLSLNLLLRCAALPRIAHAHALMCCGAQRHGGVRPHFLPRSRRCFAR